VTAWRPAPPPGEVVTELGSVRGLPALRTPLDRARAVYDLVRGLYDSVRWRAEPGDDTAERASLGKVADAAHEHWMRMAAAGRAGEDPARPSGAMGGGAGHGC